MSVEQRVDFELDSNIKFLVEYLNGLKMRDKIIEFFVRGWKVSHHVHDGSVGYPSLFKVGIKPNPVQKAEVFIRLSGKKITDEERARFDRYIFDGLVYGPLI